MMIICGRLLSLAMIFQGIEYFLLSRKESFKEIWSFENLRAELKFETLFSHSAFQKVVMMQIFTAAIGIYYPYLFPFVVLFFTHLYLCMRFRGTYNGGSDMMVFVVLTGLIIGFAGSEKWGMVYIAIHTLYSYFKAGFAKILQKDWREGSALEIFLKNSLYRPDLSLGKWACWSVIIFELYALLLPVFPATIFVYFLSALIFHFVVYMTFGLNRFFWVWMSAWPAIFYTVNLELF